MPRSSHGTDLDIIKNNKEVMFIYWISHLMTLKGEKTNKLLHKKFIWACDYCDFATNKIKKIKVAEQLNN